MSFSSSSPSSVFINIFKVSIFFWNKIIIKKLHFGGYTVRTQANNVRLASLCSLNKDKIPGWPGESNERHINKGQPVPTYL
jgi:hypothetical protein